MDEHLKQRHRGAAEGMTEKREMLDSRKFDKLYLSELLLLRLLLHFKCVSNVKYK